ncbi:hypothetical protein N7532_003192 [Penicillium argentinense]|uniref:Fibroin-3 related protein n=1 Tax=Penicillium argentinense TaxID=1131581 RepID=A0A9W9FM39_9EURO|nr:uncharacterized protein N7532_003192 [Penicillium argentinense]KAJ5102663.1 hypothetical protein N7532_003192 [Penicillium argentinense]
MHIPNTSPAPPSVFARSIADEVKSVHDWNSCMQYSWCKWPVIVGIIVASVIVIAILGCIINCLCCGYQCCKCCCGCCCPSGRRRNKQPKYYDDPPPPIVQPPPPVPNPAYQASAAPPLYRGATQTATFDTPKTANSHVDEDALPAMPTWANAVDKHVEDDSPHEDVEMKPLNPADRKGAGTPMHPGGAYSDYTGNKNVSPGGYRGFNPTDPYARRSPGPQAALNPTDPFARRSPGPQAAFAAAQDPYGRRSPGLTSPSPAVDPYGRRPSPGPPAMNTYAAAQSQDPYGRRSPGFASPVGAPSPYDHQPYDTGMNSNGYHAVTSPSPVAGYNPHNNYSPVPMAFSPSNEQQAMTMQSQTPTPGFTRQPSFGSSQYPPSYTTQPQQYRTFSPGAPSSPPPPFPAPSPHEYASHEYGAPAPGTAVGMAVGAPEPSRDRPPSLLQSGRKPAPNTYRDV